MPKAYRLKLIMHESSVLRETPLHAVPNRPAAGARVRSVPGEPEAQATARVMAVRIAGITLPDQQRVGVAITRIYGIGSSLGRRLLQEARVDPLLRTKDLTAEQAAVIRDLIEERYRVEGELRREVVENIRRLKEIGSYRGLRHSKRLPVRGQRTRTNSRTVRGNVRKTAGSGKRQAREKS